MADAGVKGGAGARRADRVVMTLDGTEHDPDAPLLRADDQGVLRGDGVFETLLVRGGEACLLDAHLERLAASARMLDLPKPDLAAWSRTARAAAQRWGGGADAMLRLVYTRGRESGGGPTAFVTVSPVPDRAARVRRDGVAVLTLDRGRSVDVATSSPWELAGAKSLSYAANMAALRYAERKGADDVVFVSAEGYVLEGPRSTVVIDRGGALLTPPVEQGILPGTTRHALFEAARARSIECGHVPLRPADLIAADGVWLLSSTTLVATVRTVNGVGIGVSKLDGAVKEMIDGAVSGSRGGGAAQPDKGSEGRQQPDKAAGVRQQPDKAPGGRQQPGNAPGGRQQQGRGPGTAR